MAGRPIPFARNSSHFVHIQNSLAAVLKNIKSARGLTANVLWVSCRLNRSGTQDSPVFVGWVEDVGAINMRVERRRPYAPIEIRFGDTHPSKLYSQCLKTPLGKVVPRNWGQPHKADATSQRIGETFYGETHRRSVPIKVDNVYAGTLNAAFSGNPSGADGEIKEILVDWAQTEKFALVKYIKDNLDFSGPKCLRQLRN
jgi:hypothetical protein